MGFYARTHPDGREPSINLYSEENHLLICVLVSAMTQDQDDIHEMVNSWKQLKIAV